MKTLRARLILSHLLPVLVILPIVVTLFVYLLETQGLLSGFTREITQQTVLVSDVASDYYEIWFNPTRGQAFVDRISTSLTANVQLVDAEGNLLVSSSPEDQNRIGEQLFEPTGEDYTRGRKNARINYNANGAVTDVTAPVIAPNGSLAGFVRLVNPLATAVIRSQQLRQTAGWVLSGGLLLGVLLGLFLANDLQRPLANATRAVYELASGRQLTPLKEQGPDEIRTLLRAFNSLVDRLRTLEESRKRLLANLVHELGRPLGAMQSAVQALSGGAVDEPELRQDLLAGMDDELHRMRRLVEDLASLHEQVLGSLELDVQPVQASDWLARVAAPWREAALEKGLQWHSQIPPDLPTLSLDADRMAQSLGNLLSNAVRYTPAGGSIYLSAVPSGDHLTIEVRDSGPGISGEEQGQIFNPFYRGRAVRRFSDGMGLGLTIARDLVTGHGGDLQVESKAGQGSTFTIRLPLDS